MPTVYKILGQASPAKDTETTVYTVPASTSAVVSSIVVTNLSSHGSGFKGITGSVSVAVRPSADATTDKKHYITYRAQLKAGERLTLTLGITLAAGDKILVNFSNVHYAVSVFGSEIS